VVDTALESPLGQIAMIPMLAWIANSAPANLKATFFAVMASFTNLALSASQLGTKYLNQVFTVTREVKDRATETISVPADYSELGWLMITAMVLGLLVPLAAVALIKCSAMATTSGSGCSRGGGGVDGLLPLGQGHDLEAGLVIERQGECVPDVLQARRLGFRTQRLQQRQDAAGPQHESHIDARPRVAGLGGVFAEAARLEVQHALESMTHGCRAARGTRRIQQASAWRRPSQLTSSSGLNQRPTSRAPFSGESEPWVRLRPTSMPKSWRMVPGAASDGLVAPRVWRTAATAFLPSQAMASTGELVM
jgi:hypothetical protein